MDGLEQPRAKPTFDEVVRVEQMLRAIWQVLEDARAAKADALRLIEEWQRGYGLAVLPRVKRK